MGDNQLIGRTFALFYDVKGIGGKGRKALFFAVVLIVAYLNMTI